MKHECFFQAVFDVSPTEGLALIEVREGLTVDDIIKNTGCTFKVRQMLLFASLGHLLVDTHFFTFPLRQCALCKVDIPKFDLFICSPLMM